MKVKTKLFASKFPSGPIFRLYIPPSFLVLNLLDMSKSIIIFLASSYELKS